VDLCKPTVEELIAVVLHFCHMSNTLTIRLPEEMLEWLRETSRVSGIPVGRLVRDKLEAARKQTGEKRFMRHAGTITGPPDLSSRKGYSRK
jgi:hypothetical protein